MITIRRPDDMHVHFRQGELLKSCIADTANSFARALVMPNTIPPVNSAVRLLSYRKEIDEALTGLPGNSDFTPLMSFKLYPDMKEEAVEALFKAGAAAGKLYPEGSTTNSEDGVKSWKQIRQALFFMEKKGIVLSVHGEKPDSFVLDREKDYLPELGEIIENYPDLKIVLEHVSGKDGVDFVLAGPPSLAATITVHHLYLTLDDLIGGGINPHNFCKPVVKTPSDRAAVRKAALSGNNKFFFGSDSAPHPETSKLKKNGSAGIYSAPCALSLLASFFEKNSSLELMENFTSRFGAEFYSLDLNKDTITLEKKSFKIPENRGRVIPFMGGEEAQWSLV
ncbi:MAG: dihydroorotase [Spirochaetia bacterium]|jgi:dihydroorotase|nr:dihydroorotase [Spirochaetia bacterium]